ncbi:MAG: hypothetical protein AAFR36_32750 [Bacteroidota bacterium]
MNRSMSLFLLAAILLQAAPVGAKTTTIDFEGGLNIETSKPPDRSSGIWREDNFNVHWVMQTYLHYFGIFDLENYTGFEFLSVTDPGPDPDVARYLEVSRPNGGTFNLKGIHTNYTYNGVAVVGQLSAENGEDWRTTVPLASPSLLLTAEKSDGSILTEFGYTKFPSNRDENIRRDLSFLATDLVFDGEDFHDLVSLRLEAFLPRYADEIMTASIIESMRTFEPRPEFTLGITECGLSICTIPGVGTFDFYTDILGPRNDELYVHLGNIAVEIAPVPLPGSSILILSGLGLLLLNRSSIWPPQHLI